METLPLKLAWVATLRWRQAALVISFDRLFPLHSGRQVSDTGLLCGDNERRICMKQHGRIKSTGYNPSHVAYWNLTASMRNAPAHNGRFFWAKTSRCGDVLGNTISQGEKRLARQDAANLFCKPVNGEQKLQ